VLLTALLLRRHQGRIVLRSRAKDLQGKRSYQSRNAVENAPLFSVQNFLALCASGYYDNTVFHRNIKKFIVQGGDPTGTGKGGSSIYGKYFDDEISDVLKVGALRSSADGF
jgi:hypothetical protein